MILVVDTNVLLHSIDLLEDPRVGGVIVPQTALDEARTRDRTAAQRARALVAASAGPPPPPAGAAEAGETPSSSHPPPPRGFHVFSNEHRRGCRVEARAGESPNDRNDRAIRAAAVWLGGHWSRCGQSRESERADGADSDARSAAAAVPVEAVWLLTDDADCRRRLVAEAAEAAATRGGGVDRVAVEAVSVAEYRRRRAEGTGPAGVGAETLGGVVADAGGGRGGGGEGGGGEGRGGDERAAKRARRDAGGPALSSGAARPARGARGDDDGAQTPGTHRGRPYPAHISPADVSAGLRSGALVRGRLRVQRGQWSRGVVRAENTGVEYAIRDRRAMNRATEGDAVVIRPIDDGNVGEGGGGGDDRSGTPAPKKEGEAPDDDSEATDDGAGGGRGIPGAVGVVDWDDGGGDDARAATVEAAAAPDGAQDRLERGASLVSAVVVAIERRAWRNRGYAGRLLPPRDAAERAAAASGRDVDAVFLPACREVPSFRVRTRQWAALLDRRIICAPLEWPADRPRPLARHVRALPGRAGDLECETEVLLHEHDVPSAPFTSAVLACVPATPWRVSTGDVAEPGRLDLRSVCVASVDPPGCRDIDDALSCEPWPGADDGTLRIGVHVADVAHFVTPGTALDAEAARRSTSTYLVQRRLDMLPKALTEDICSLRGGVDRLAFSCLLRVTPAGDVVSYEFARCVVRSRAALTYREAQDRIDALRARLKIAADAPSADVVAAVDRGAPSDVADGDVDGDGSDPDPAPYRPPGGGDEPRRVDAALLRLDAVAKALRARRRAAGALELASPEQRFVLEGEGDALTAADVRPYETFDAHRLVEEMMLLANARAAETTARAYPRRAVLRRHPPPPPGRLDALAEDLAAPRGGGGGGGDPSAPPPTALATTSNRALADSLDRVARRHRAAASGGGAAAAGSPDPFFPTLVRLLVTRCMSQAAYCPAGRHAGAEAAHYGLALPLYTHFTSPIRRYADLLVHRLLACAAGAAGSDPAGRGGGGDGRCAPGADPPAESFGDPDRLADQCDHMNERHRAAQLAGRASGELFLVRHLSSTLGVGGAGGAGGGGAGAETAAGAAPRPSARRTPPLAARVVKIDARGRRATLFVPRYGVEGSASLDPTAADGPETAEAAADVAAGRLVLFGACAATLGVVDRGHGRRELEIRLHAVGRSGEGEDALAGG